MNAVCITFMYNVSYSQEPHLIKGKAKLDWERIPPETEKIIDFFRDIRN